MTTNTATLTDIPAPSNIIEAQVYRLSPPLDGVEYVAASTVTGEQNPLLPLLFGVDKHTALFATDEFSTDADPDEFLGSHLEGPGRDKDIPEAFAEVGYTVVA